MLGNIKKQTSVNKFLGGREKVRVAVIQAASNVFNKDKLIDKACRMIKEAGANGAELVAFPECYLPTFPQIYNPGDRPFRQCHRGRQRGHNQNRRSMP